NLTLDKKLVNIKSTLGIKFDLSNLKQAETFLNIPEDKKISTLKEIFDSKIKAFISDHLQEDFKYKTRDEIEKKLKEYLKNESSKMGITLFDTTIRSIMIN
ncbi:MAG: SPFH domain-containing protein, partial [bacterium]